MGDLLKGCDMNNRNKLIELFIYIVIVVVGIVLLLTGGADDKTSAENMGGESYEIPVFHKALSECGSLEVRPVAICVPQEIQEYCMELFGEDVQIAAASHDLFAKRANGQIYRPLVEKYIAGEKRL